MIRVKKRSGKKEDFNVDKIHQVLSWAVEGIENVSISDIEMESKLSLYDGITSQEIHSTLIRAAGNLISEEKPEYQYVASRLLSYNLRKLVWGGAEPPRLLDHIKQCIKDGVYDQDVIENYTESEIHKISRFIKHDRDYLFSFAGLQQLVDKYLVKNKKSGKVYETPQFAYILIPIVLFSNYDKSTRLDYIKRAYEMLSTFKISLPTPIMCGVRTPVRQYSSCILIDCGDSIDSIFASATAVGYYTARRAGIGINAGRIRAIGSQIRGGEVIHTGVIPFLKVFESTVKSCSQNGVRGGSGTVSFPFFHYEIEDVIPLKNNSGTDDNRVRKLDYCIQFSKLFYQRCVEDREITLFSPHETPDLYDKFGFPEFDELYEKYESASLTHKRKIRARSLLEQFSRERIETGRIYVANIDHINQNSAWNIPVKMTNLCVAPETLLLTDKGYFPIKDLENKSVNVWNGKQWSRTKVQKTGTNQKLITVHLSDGKTLTCTEYHKWYTVNSYNDNKRGKLTEKRSIDLKIGDKICKFKSPVISGSDQIVDPYTQGLFSADGTYEKDRSGNIKRARISLYGEKKKLLDKLSIKKSRGEDSSGTLNVVLNDNISQKYTVPINSSVENKLSWLSGLIDGDGCSCNSYGTTAIQICSIKNEFLRDIQILLQSLGVESKIRPASDERSIQMPNGKGGSKWYKCQKSERILISGYSVSKLVNLGLKTNRVKIENISQKRNTDRFVTVTKIEDCNRFDDTYCVNEPLEHKAVFNGILTGNCNEITQPTKPLNHIDDEEAEIGVCTLSAINLLEVTDYESVCDIIVRMLDELIDYQDYPVKAARKFAVERRSLGVGITNFAAFLAKNKLSYNSLEAAQLASEVAEKTQYYLLKASCNLAKEKGACMSYNDTTYSQDIMPLNRYNKEVDKISKSVMDWTALTDEIKKYGLRNSTLTAQMPCESSSVIQNSTNGIEPVRKIVTYKKSKMGNIKQIIPNIKHAKYYTLAFDCNNESITNISASIQRWFDMAMSTNHYYDYDKFENGEIPLSTLAKDMFYMYKMGCKTLYYTNTKDIDSESSCASGSCSI